MAKKGANLVLRLLAWHGIGVGDVKTDACARRFVRITAALAAAATNLANRHALYSTDWCIFNARSRVHDVSRIEDGDRAFYLSLIYLSLI